jgi:hypothetical protein
VFSAHGARDLADPDDRFILRIEVAHAARSSDDTSRWLKKRFTTFRAQGRITTHYWWANWVTSGLRDHA